MLALDSVRPDTAAVLLIAAGDDFDRLLSEAAFAHLCEIAPAPAFSWKVVRHCIDPGGNRNVNRALLVVALNCPRRDPGLGSMSPGAPPRTEPYEEVLKAQVLHSPRGLPRDPAGHRRPASQRVDAARDVEPC